MGYTIHTKQKRDFTDGEWENISSQVRTLVRSVDYIKGGDGFGEPFIDDERIIFNGAGDTGDDHETFVLNKNTCTHSFCKTAEKPYDTFVKASLLIANYYAPDVLNFHSDGKYIEEWYIAKDLDESILGHTITFKLS